jgi:hypothetical protein
MTHAWVAKISKEHFARKKEKTKLFDIEHAVFHAKPSPEKRWGEGCVYSMHASPKARAISISILQIIMLPAIWIPCFSRQKRVSIPHLILFSARGAWSGIKRGEKEEMRRVLYAVSPPSLPHLHNNQGGGGLYSCRPIPCLPPYIYVFYARVRVT